MPTYYCDQQGYSVLAEADRSNPTAQNGDWTDRPASGDFILAYQTNEDGCNKATSACTQKVQFDKDGDDNWTDVGASTEIAWGTSTVLVDGTNTANRLTGTALNCGSIMTNCYENEGDNTISVPATSSGEAVEIQVALNLDNAVGGVVYRLRIYGVSDGAELTDSPLGSTITVAVLEDITFTPIDPGSYSVSAPVGANLEYHRVFDDALAGSISVTGQDVTLKKAKNFPCDPGSYSVSAPVETILLNHQILDAQPDSYDITGQDANLEYHRSFDAETTSFDVTGTDANLFKSIPIDAEAGAFDVTGTDADLLRQLALDCEAGSIAVTGQDADFIRDLEIDAAAGSIDITGQDVTLTKTGAAKILAEEGSVSVTGTDANLEYHHVMPADPGSLSVTGMEALFSRMLHLDADPGTYDLTGQDATLTKSGARHLTLEVDPGAVILTGTAAQFLVCAYAAVESSMYLDDCGNFYQEIGPNLLLKL